MIFVLPESSNRISIEGCIGADDRDAFDHSLSDYEPVERVTVVVGQTCQRRYMSRFNHQNAELIRCDFLFHKYIQRLGQRILVDADLDSNFPVAGRADLDIVIRISDQCSGRRAQLRIVQYKSQESLSIEKQPAHGMYSLKSFK